MTQVQCMDACGFAAAYGCCSTRWWPEATAVRLQPSIRFAADIDTLRLCRSLNNLVALRATAHIHTLRQSRSTEHIPPRVVVALQRWPKATTVRLQRSCRHQYAAAQPHPSNLVALCATAEEILNNLVAEFSDKKQKWSCLKRTKTAAKTPKRRDAEVNFRPQWSYLAAQRSQGFILDVHKVSKS